jgi:hypothetical protein
MLSYSARSAACTQYWSLTCPCVLFQSKQHASLRTFDSQSTVTVHKFEFFRKSTFQHLNCISIWSLQKPVLTTHHTDRISGRLISSSPIHDSVAEPNQECTGRAKHLTVSPDHHALFIHTRSMSDVTDLRRVPIGTGPSSRPGKMLPTRLLGRSHVTMILR